MGKSTPCGITVVPPLHMSYATTVPSQSCLISLLHYPYYSGHLLHHPYYSGHLLHHPYYNGHSQLFILLVQKALMCFVLHRFYSAN